MNQQLSLIAQEMIEQKIFIIRGKKTMLDKDLAELYAVPTGALMQAVKRNIQRFPFDFMFQLTQQEFTTLKSHFVISKGRGRYSQTTLCLYRTRNPYALRRLEQRQSHRSQHPDHAYIYQIERTNAGSQGSTDKD